MRALIQEACQGPVRDVVAGHAARLAELSEADLRPVVLRDFQARPPGLPGLRGLNLTYVRHTQNSRGCKLRVTRPICGLSCCATFGRALPCSGSCACPLGAWFA
jgi:hypothetical protein